MTTKISKTKPDKKQQRSSTVCAKKVIAVVFAALTMVAMGITTAFAAVDPSAFITTSMTVLKAVICLIGAGLAVWGVVNLIEGYGNDNPGANAHVR